MKFFILSGIFYALIRYFDKELFPTGSKVFQHFNKLKTFKISEKGKYKRNGELKPLKCSDKY